MLLNTQYCKPCYLALASRSIQPSTACSNVLPLLLCLTQKGLAYHTVSVPHEYHLRYFKHLSATHDKGTFQIACSMRWRTQHANHTSQDSRNGKGQVQRAGTCTYTYQPTVARDGTLMDPMVFRCLKCAHRAFQNCKTRLTVTKARPAAEPQPTVLVSQILHPSLGTGSQAAGTGMSFDACKRCFPQAHNPYKRMKLCRQWGPRGVRTLG